MVLKDNIMGAHVVLRTALEEDAEFILSLRLDPELNRFLHKTDPSIDKQKAWIAGKAAQADDLVMIIEGRDGKPLGVIAIYNIDWKRKAFEWGRWVIAKGAPLYAAAESVALLYHVAFNVLNMELAELSTTKANTRVVDFHKSYGARETHFDSENVYFKFTRKDFEKMLEKHRSLKILDKG